MLFYAFLNWSKLILTCYSIYMNVSEVTLFGLDFYTL